MDEGYLLDTSVASAAGYAGHRLHQGVRTWLSGLGDNTVFVSAVTLAESEYGLNLVPLPANIKADIRSAMATYTVLPIDRHTAEIYGRIRGRLFNAYAPRDHRNRISSRYVEDLRERTSGKQLGIQENDLWIVSVAVQYNLIFVTGDGGGGMRNIVDEADYVDRTRFWPSSVPSRPIDSIDEDN